MPWREPSPRTDAVEVLLRVEQSRSVNLVRDLMLRQFYLCFEGFSRWECSATLPLRICSCLVAAPATLPVRATTIGDPGSVILLRTVPQNRGRPLLINVF